MISYILIPKKEIHIHTSSNDNDDQSHCEVKGANTFLTTTEKYMVSDAI